MSNPVIVYGSELTDAELENLDRIWGAATPGPWTIERVAHGMACESCGACADYGIKLVLHHERKWIGEVAPPADATQPTWDNIANATAMARARTDVPRLVEEVRRLRAEIARSKETPGASQDEPTQTEVVSVGPEKVDLGVLTPRQQQQAARALAKLKRRTR